MLRKLILLTLATITCGELHAPGLRASALGNVCSRSPVGSAVPEPEDLRSRNGVLSVDLTVENTVEPDGPIRYCYVDGQGNQAPTLRLNPGDLLVLHLKNRLTEADSAASTAKHVHGRTTAKKNPDPCTSGAMTPTSTQSPLPRFDHSAGLPPGRCPEDIDRAGDPAVRISLSHSGERAPWIVLVPPAYSRIQLKPRFWAARPARSSSRESSGPTRKWRDCRSACWSFAIRIY